MKKNMILCLLILFATALTACSYEEDKNISKDKQIYQVYYLNNTRTALVSEDYTAKGEKTQDLYKELTEAISVTPKNLSYKKALPDAVEINKFSMNEDGQLTIDFTSDYLNLTGGAEILCRVAIVKTLSQIEAVKYVGFNVEGQPLMDSQEKVVPFMSAEDIIDNTGGKNALVTLYFADPKGAKLRVSRIRMNFDGTVPLEQVIVERLIRGPGTIEGIDEDIFFPTLPEDTDLLKTSTQSGICSVYLDEDFLEKLEDVKEEVAIYSIVNSLVELSSIKKVQFYINEELVKNFKEYKEFDKLFERNLDIVIE